jgi:hypothetical protein
MAEELPYNGEHKEPSDDDDEETGAEQPKKPLKQWLPPLIKSPLEGPAKVEEVKKSVEFIPPPLIELERARPPEVEEAAELALTTPAENEAAPVELSAEERLSEVSPEEASSAPHAAEAVDLPEDPVHLRRPPQPMQQPQRLAELLPEDEPKVRPAAPPAFPFGGKAPAPTAAPAERTEAPPPVHHNLAPEVRRPSGVVPAAVEQVARTAAETERHILRRGLVAAFLTGYAFKAFMAERRQRSREQQTERAFGQRDEVIAKQGDQIGRLEREQHQLKEQLAKRFEPYKLPHEVARPTPAGGFEAPAQKPAAEALPVEQAMEEEIFDMEGNKITLQPGWHVERAPGGYSYVRDNHNRIVYNAIQYGEAFRREQKREQLGDDVFAAVDSGASIGGGSTTDDSVRSVPVPLQQIAQPPTVNPYDQPGQVDLDHRLEAPKHPVLSTFTSPWLWTAIAILIIVYFIAALA